MSPAGVAFEWRRVFHSPVTALADLPGIDLDRQQVRGVQFAHALQRCARFRNILVMEVEINRHGVQVKRHQTGAEQRLHFGSEEQLPVALE